MQRNDVLTVKCENNICKWWNGGYEQSHKHQQNMKNPRSYYIHLDKVCNKTDRKYSVGWKLTTFTIWEICRPCLIFLTSRKYDTRGQTVSSLTLSHTRTVILMVAVSTHWRSIVHIKFCCIHRACNSCKQNKELLKQLEGTYLMVSIYIVCFHFYKKVVI